jgi:hypothetical protein
MRVNDKLSEALYAIKYSVQSLNQEQNSDTMLQSIAHLQHRLCGIDMLLLEQTRCTNQDIVHQLDKSLYRAQVNAKRENTKDATNAVITLKKKLHVALINCRDTELAIKRML